MKSNAALDYPINLGKNETKKKKKTSQTNSFTTSSFSKIIKEEKNEREPDGYMIFLDSLCSLFHSVYNMERKVTLVHSRIGYRNINHSVIQLPYLMIAKEWKKERRR